MIANRGKIWSDEAQNLTFRAVNKAGFTKKYFKGLRDIIFVTEPEAAALYSIKWFMADDDDEDFLEVSCSCHLISFNY
jgi:hypothetical protein